MGKNNQVDSFDLSRPKRNITRDFSDGQLVAEIVYHYLPKVVNLHSFVKANSSKNKKKNWKVLTTKVFPKMGFKASQADINNVINSKRMAAENFLSVLRNKLESTERVDLFATANQPLKKKKKSTNTGTLGTRMKMATFEDLENEDEGCLLYTSPSPRDS